MSMSSVKYFLANICLTSVLTILIVWIFTFDAQSQFLKETLQKNAFEINATDTAYNKNLSDLLQKYNLIMVGEMHGTREPAQFVSYLILQLLKSGRQVNLGMEIPASQMKKFIKSPSLASLSRSEFFTSAFKDGRSNTDWLNLIASHFENKRVNMFFFDVDPSKSIAKPDSAMYAVIRENMMKNPSSITVLICGNIHNRLIPFGGAKTAACYLANDASLGLANKMLSISHQFKYGTMHNVTRDGFGIHKIEPTPSTFSGATSFKNYFAFLGENTDAPYNAIYYTEEVTAADMKSARD